MRQPPSTMRLAHLAHPVGRQPAPGAIEWEELPSLAAKVREIARRGVVAPAGTAWDATRPATLDDAVASAPFREPVEGVAVREVIEPNVFRHFFGS